MRWCFFVTLCTTATVVVTFWCWYTCTKREDLAAETEWNVFSIARLLSLWQRSITPHYQWSMASTPLLRVNSIKYDLRGTGDKFRLIRINHLPDCSHKESILIENRILIHMKWVKCTSQHCFSFLMWIAEPMPLLTSERWQPIIFNKFESSLNH